MYLSLSLSLYIYIYIHIHIHRERERGRESARETAHTSTSPGRKTRRPAKAVALLQLLLQALPPQQEVAAVLQLPLGPPAKPAKHVAALGGAEVDGPGEVHGRRLLRVLAVLLELRQRLLEGVQEDLDEGVAALQAHLRLRLPRVQAGHLRQELAAPGLAARLEDPQPVALLRGAGAPLLALLQRLLLLPPDPLGELGAGALLLVEAPLQAQLVLLDLGAVVGEPLLVLVYRERFFQFGTSTTTGGGRGIVIRHPPVNRGGEGRQESG